MQDQISKVLDGNLCAGCGGCAAVAPDATRMRISSEGYARPSFSRELHPDEHQALASICPSIAQTCDAGARQSDPLWGPYISSEKGYSTDPSLRHHAASGGALSGFLSALLDRKTVDGIIHVRADPTDPLANVVTVSTTPRAVLDAAGSRYAPSSPLEILAKLRGDGKRYAFVGKPCDVSALRSLRDLDSQISKMVPILVSFFCAGVPSLHGGRDILRRMGVAPDAVKSFQHRGEGWPGCATAELSDGGSARMSYSESWGEILSKTVQHRCKICADGSGVFADVVFADAWEADTRGYPSFKDRPGQSLVLCRTALGRSLVDEAQKGGQLKLAPYDLAQLEAVQPGQSRRRRVLLARLAAHWVLGRPQPRYRGLGLGAMARQASAMELARNFAGTVRRLMRAPIKEEGQC